MYLYFFIFPLLMLCSLIPSNIFMVVFILLLFLTDRPYLSDLPDFLINFPNSSFAFSVVKQNYCDHLFFRNLCIFPAAENLHTNHFWWNRAGGKLLWLQLHILQWPRHHPLIISQPDQSTTVVGRYWAESPGFLFI